ncbi:dihydrolipoyllysine-residue acetyltransferase [Cocleimonas sp. KMM 6892]|uniref:dihydrolipoyllysine-residue acetyltransferase n=1 Tax=unclassified Cocleimonas TaxID=2639732 RepID=UPI002DBAB8D1|nr:MULTISPECIES: dihydrolipoyllysine-residue acetyltransferase [unclassified Cocleimonas]MEB8433425.1 dihydrolipoyllysine-residue acetyltransferase [Cocleimonas sp. KMM 6892]MEC4716236.1 dihydrolipoyllysine-residue acetyltransferase [Cocleimonas sp. KMM 6895]MEC4745871.1 dihydrolipoyllysine-residue acetyltransferase [Cocleimonas sp. KMM 6896]
MSIKEIVVPDIGDFDAVEVIEVLVAEGDFIEAEDSIVTVESDKASMEIPSSASGKVLKLKVGLGDNISEGTVLLMLEVDDSEKAEPSSKDSAATDTAEKPSEPVTTEAPATPESKSEKPAAASTSSAGTTSIEEIVVPDIGDFDEVEVIEVLVAEGDMVEAEDSLITVESDKASMEIPSSASGKVLKVKVNIGDKVSEGSVLLMMEVNSGGSDAKPEAAPEPKEDAVKLNVTAPAEAKPSKSSVDKLSPTVHLDEKRFSKAYASPSVRKFARELGVDLGEVSGTSRKGRINKDDVKGFVKKALTTKSAGSSLGVAPMPEIDYSKFGEIETQSLSKINKLTGEFLHRSWVTVPHVTQFDEADITEMEAFRKQMGKEMEKDGIKITPLAFIIRAVVTTLKLYPRFNSSLDNTGENLILKKYFNIGVAVDTPDGLVVPVIREVDQKSLVEISQEIRQYAQLARDKKLKPSDMQGGCFTISSLGGIGGTKFTPIVNAPEVAVLGVSKSSMQPQWDGTEFKPRLMLPLSLSYDHRVIDGADGARFTSHLSKMLSDIRRMMV